MSAGTITVTDGWNSVKANVKNIGDVTPTDQLRMANIVDEQIRDEIASAAPERVITSTNLSIISGTSSYSLPSDFENINIEETGLFKLDSNGKVEEELTQTEFGSTQYGYYIDGSNVIITPEPTDSYTITLKYLPERTELTAVSDIFSVPNAKKYREVVRQGLLVEYYHFKRRFDLKQFAEIDYRATMDDLIDKIQQNPKVSSLPETSISF